MQKKKEVNQWLLLRFSTEEWVLIKQTWNDLVSNNKVIIGDGKFIMDNFNILINEIKSRDN